MANSPGNCPQLSKSTWCTVREDPGCTNATDTCILVRQAAQSKAGSVLSALEALPDAVTAARYLSALDEWIDQAPREPLDLSEIPLPR